MSSPEPSLSRTERLTLGILALAGVLLRLPWALLSPTPWDDDALYYQSIADNIVAGRGAVTDTVFILSAPPASLPAPADLYWMPLPSRVIVPLTAAFGELGGPLTSALLGALLGPLAWALARTVPGISRQTATLAGVMAILGGYHLRLLATADCYALAAALGGVAFWAVAKERAGVVAACAVGLILARSDGVLMVAALAAGLSLRGAVGVLAAGGATAGLWTLRTYLVGGADALAAKGIAGRALEYRLLFDGTPLPSSTIGDRIARVGQAMMSALPGYWGLATLALFAPLVLWGAWQIRDQAWARSWAAGFFIVPILACVLAPVVVEHGTLHRSGAALLMPTAVLLALGVASLTAALNRMRAYPVVPTQMFIAAIYLGMSIWVGVKLTQTEIEAPTCPTLPAEARLLSSDPLRVSYHCDRSTVLYWPTIPEARLMALSRQYELCHLLSSEAPDNLTGWTEVSANVWRHPDWNGVGCH